MPQTASSSKTARGRSAANLNRLAMIAFVGIDLGYEINEIRKKVQGSGITNARVLCVRLERIRRDLAATLDAVDAGVTALVKRQQQQ